LEKWKRAGGMGKTTIFFLPPSRHRTQETGKPTVEGGRGAGDLVHGDGWEVGRNEEEVEGNRFRSLPRAGGAPERRIDGGGRSATRNGTGGAGGGDGELGEEGGLVVEVRDEVASQSGPFIGA
jgi:hypothetical protein